MKTKDENKLSMHAIKRLCLFALPIVAGGLLQQFYTVVDAIIVGRNVGNTGLAAIGISGSIISFLIFIVCGVGVGLTVVLSKYSGPGNEEHFRNVALTARNSGLIVSVFVTALCLIFAEAILMVFRTPNELLYQSALYLRIMSIGLPFSFLYNYYNALLLSTENSKAPFLALLAAAITNIVLTYLFTSILGLGVLGAATGSVIALVVSYAVCLIYVKRYFSALTFPIFKLTIDRECLREVLAYGGASAFQKLLFHGGKLLIQGAVNMLAISVIAGYSAATQIEAFVLSAMDGVGVATSRYIAQRMGIDDREGASRALLSGVCLSVLCAALIAAAIYFLSPYIIELFVKDGEKLASGVLYLRTMSLCYMVLSLSDTLLALLRGLGMMKRAILATIIQMTFRVGATYLLINSLGLTAICYGTLTGWIAITLFNGLFALKWISLSKE